MRARREGREEWDRNAVVLRVTAFFLTNGRRSARCKRISDDLISYMFNMIYKFNNIPLASGA